MTRNLLIALALLVVTPSAFAKGGFTLALDAGAAGGSQMSTASGKPTLKYGGALGGIFHNGKRAFGLYGDVYENSIWNAGLEAKEFFGGKRIFWLGIKVSIIGISQMVNTTGTVTWDEWLQGAVGVGMRIPLGKTANLQPYIEYNSFTPVKNNNTVLPRHNIPAAGMRLALEF